MLIDEFLPVFDLAMHHRVEIDAPIEEVYAVVRNLDLTRAKLVRALFWLRSLPARLQHRPPLGLTLEDLQKTGLILLGEAPPHELALGFVGKPWTGSGEFEKLDSQGFREFGTPGFAKAVWNFSLARSQDGRTRLATETRVQCLDEASRRKFRRYAFFIRPLSGVTRQDALRACKRQAEARAHPFRTEQSP